MFLDSLGCIVRMRPVSSLCYLFTVVTVAMMKRRKKYFSLEGFILVYSLNIYIVHKHGHFGVRDIKWVGHISSVVRKQGVGRKLGQTIKLQGPH